MYPKVTVSSQGEQGGQGVAGVVTGLERSVARFWSKVDFLRGPVHPTLGRCWAWAAARDDDGYGVMTSWPGTNRAHRISYELTNGTIPGGLQLDHLCRVRKCVRPSHLEPVTSKINCLRGMSFAAENARKTHCIHGHAFAAENTLLTSDGRSCKACALERSRRYKERVRQAHPTRRRCGSCGVVGHASQSCKTVPWTKRMTPGKGENIRGDYRCSRCSQSGHNAQTCGSTQAALQ